jgi:hypothetical protein
LFSSSATEQLAGQALPDGGGECNAKNTKTIVTPERSVPPSEMKRITCIR